MSQQIALVSCVKSKRDVPSPAADLYTSPLFRFLRQYAEANSDRWYILSAEHGLLDPDEVVAPYERTLNRMSATERRNWAARVQRDLLQKLPMGSRVIMLAGERYREGLIPFLKLHGHSVSVPLEGLSFGRQLRRLKELNARPQEPLERFYELLAELSKAPEQGHPLSTYTGRGPWPPRGVYFLLEPGEFRRDRPDSLRVVRIGTHAVSAGSRSSLWGRLRAHRGGEDLSGNHRGSVFRLHVGTALLEKSGNERTPGRTWGTPGGNRSVREGEAWLEKAVSEHLGQMRVLWTAVEDEPGKESHRAFIERNAIALLSNRLNPFDPPSADWLGQHSPRREIRESGLWNLNYVFEEVDTSFLDLLEGYVRGREPRSREVHPAESERQAASRSLSPAVTASEPEQLTSTRESRANLFVRPTPTLVPCASRSRFFKSIEAGLTESETDLLAGQSILVPLGSGGYEGEYLVRVRTDSDAFETNWVGSDLTRFPARIRAAATALRRRRIEGLFLISHRRGSLSIRRVGESCDCNS